jgi:hypothetical protein
MARREWCQVPRGERAGKCRLRTGDYRLQFHVDQETRVVTETKTVKGKQVKAEKEVTDYTVTVEKVGHRDGFYEE